MAAPTRMSAGRNHRMKLHYIPFASQSTDRHRQKYRYRSHALFLHSLSEQTFALQPTMSPPPQPAKFLLPSDSSSSHSDSAKSSMRDLTPDGAPLAGGSFIMPPRVDLPTRNLQAQFRREHQRYIEPVISRQEHLDKRTPTADLYPFASPSARTAKVDRLTYVNMRRAELEPPRGRTLRRPGSEQELSNIGAAFGALDSRGLPQIGSGNTTTSAIERYTNPSPPADPQMTDLYRAQWETPPLDGIPMIENGRIPSMDIPPLDTGSPAPPRRHDHLHPRPTMHYFPTGMHTPHTLDEGFHPMAFRNPFQTTDTLLPHRDRAIAYAPRRGSSFVGTALETTEVRRKHREMMASVADAQEKMRPDAVRGWHRDSLLLMHTWLNHPIANAEFDDIQKENRRSLRRSSSI